MEMDMAFASYLELKDNQCSIASSYGFYMLNLLLYYFLHKTSSPLLRRK